MKMKNMTLENIAKACNGEYIGDESLKSNIITGVEKDSRLIEDGFLYVPFAGARVDGHDFINQCFEKGAICSLSEKKLDNVNGPYILVESTAQALKDIAEFYREQLDCKVIGITGSVGKTSTKEIIASVLSEKFSVLKTEGNYNNEIGEPLTVLKIRDNHEIAVIEMGMSGFNEIEYLVNIVNPKIGVISNIGLSHVERLGSREGIFKAKMEITTNFDENSTLIVNGDDDMLATLKGKDLKYNLKTFGFEKDNTIYCVDFEMNDNDTIFNVMIDNKIEKFYIPTVGEHNIYNAMAAILVGQTLNLTLDEIRNGLETLEITKSRMDVIKNDNYTVIDSVYNASVDSMRAALKVLNRYENRKVAVLGDMFEMGSFAEEGHREVGKCASEYADILIAVGDDAKFMVDEAIKNNMDKENTYYFKTKEEAIENFENILQKGDAILVKASRGMHLEEVVEFLSK